jgi:hypothetical protein
MQPSSYVTVIALAAALLGACGDGGSDAPDADTGPDAGIGCKNDPRGEQYSANMAHVGSAGMFKFVLVASDPAPPVKGNNSWTVKLLDPDGQPVTGATLTTTPFMPDHGHGTSAIPVTTPAADGYTIAPLYLFMPGLWQVTIHATSGAVSDQAVFNFCIQG